MTFLVALAAALAPSMSISMISTPELTKLKTWWLLGVMWLGAGWLLLHEPWLGVMAVWYCIKWRSMAEHPGLLTWAAIGATWFLLRGMPGWAWDWIPWGWLAIAGWHVLKVARRSWSKSPHARRPLWGLWRTPATQGSPAITALSLALVAPFCPWWGWPLLAVGLYLTWSWLALVGVAVGLSVLYPTYAALMMALLALVMAAWFLSWRTGRKLFEWTPRGDSFDSVINRLIVWWLVIKGWWGGPRWLGRGPYTLDKELTRWSSRCWIELPVGEACCDPLQHLYEYGAVGIAALVCFALRVGGGLAVFGGSNAGLGAHWGDPWTAALVAAGAMSFGHYPTRHPAIGLVVLTVAAGVGR